MHELDLHVPQTSFYRDRIKVTSDFPLHTFQHCKLTISIFIPTLSWPHPIVYPLTVSQRLYFLGVKVKFTMSTTVNASHIAQRACVERQLSPLPELVCICVLYAPTKTIFGQKSWNRRQEISFFFIAKFSVIEITGLCLYSGTLVRQRVCKVTGTAVGFFRQPLMPDSERIKKESHIYYTTLRFQEHTQQ